MSIKAILGLIVLMLSLGTLITAVSWISNMGSMTPEENTAQATALIIDDVTPWWITPIVWLSGLGIFGAILIIALLYFSKKYGML
jgi:hypothetical protein